MFLEDAFSLLSFCILITINLILCSRPSPCTEMDTRHPLLNWTAILHLPPNIYIEQPTCFALSNTRMQYESAKTACATLNEGRLLILEPRGKLTLFNSLRNIIAPSMMHKDYWLGLHRIPVSLDWVWSDSNQSPLTYDEWRTDQPDPTAVVAYADGDDKWISTDVNDEHLIFCEFSLASDRPLTTLNPSPGASSSPPPEIYPELLSNDFLYQRTTYLPSSFRTRISTSRNALDCASWCSGVITCYGFHFHRLENACILFTLDVSSQSPVPDCTRGRCYHKINVLTP